MGRIFAGVLLAFFFTASGATSMTLGFKGTFDPPGVVAPGTSPIFRELWNGTYTGVYEVPTGSLPGVRGTSLSFSSFLVSAFSPDGRLITEFRSGRDFGTLFFDSLGRGIYDTFVFANLASTGLQFQIDVPIGFTGTGPIVSAGIFGRSNGPVGGAGSTSGTTYAVPLPVSFWLLLAGSGLIVGVVASRRRYS